MKNSRLLLVAWVGTCAVTATGSDSAIPKHSNAPVAKVDGGLPWRAVMRAVTACASRAFKETSGSSPMRVADETKKEPPKVEGPKPLPPTVPVTMVPASDGSITQPVQDTDIRTVLTDLGVLAGVTVLADDSLRDQTITIEFKNDRIESALSKLCLLLGAYWKKQAEGVYIMSKATPEAPMFREFAVTETYVPQNQPAPSIQALLPPHYKPYVSVDAKINMLAITAPEVLLRRIVADLERLDSPSRQFTVEALVTEITTDRNKDLGFSWSWKNFAVASDLSLGYDRASVADVAKLKAMIEKREATLRANPRVTAFEGRESTLNVGQDTYYSLLAGNPNYPSAQIQLIKTGVTLKFTGFVSKDGTITLDLEPEVSDSVMTVNGNPTTNVRRASTNVRIKSGETIVIGGLVQEGVDRRVSRVPILGALPIIGDLFTNRSTRSRRTEIIIMITPHLSDQGTPDRGMDSNRKLPPP